ncbi:hypothetical protein DSOL_4217 [Desulfosporosinus metallidurans]|uniref:Uncharacterized protein n=1 Tax=Desulfosporosinus metallidurans TaxID=1888891 RepID=A0A1Q8QL55_9FIRM|nr:hypothetical protein DSOL_4217 [Desulfosporosinus metallidurans]
MTTHTENGIMTERLTDAQRLIEQVVKTLELVNPDKTN